VGGEPDVGSLEYPLFLEDVHYMFRCAVVLKDEVRSSYGLTVVWCACVRAHPVRCCLSSPSSSTHVTAPLGPLVLPSHL
jgi:hypothetical protein